MAPDLYRNHLPRLIVSPSFRRPQKATLDRNLFLRLILVLWLVTSLVNCSRGRGPKVDPNSVNTTAGGPGGAGGTSDGPGLGDSLPSEVPIRGTMTLLPSSDTGFSNSDRVTRLTTPTLTGRMDSNANFMLLANKVTVAQGQANGNGDFLVTTPALADGAYTFQARWGRADGQVGTQVIQVCIDSAAPINLSIALDPGSDSGRSNTDGITNEKNPVFLVGATERLPEHDKEEFHKVRYRIFDKTSADPNVLLFDSLAADGVYVAPGAKAFKIGGPGLSDGAHQIFLGVEDLAGNMSQTDP